MSYADQRYYATGAGRFMTADPSLASDGGDPESWNLYSYVQGDPLNFGDDQGLARTNIIWNSFLAREKSNKWSFTFSFLPQQVTLGLYGPGVSIHSGDRQGGPRPPRSGIHSGDIKRDAVRNVIYEMDRDSNFTPQTLDCMAGIESRWNPKAKSGGHRGLFQMNENYWRDTGVPLSFGSNVEDPAASTMVVVAGLYKKLAAGFGGRQDEFQSILNSGGLFTRAQIHGALQGHRGSGNSGVNNAYADAILNCASEMQKGNFQKGMDWIAWYGEGDRTGAFLK